MTGFPPWVYFGVGLVAFILVVASVVSARALKDRSLWIRVALYVAAFLLLLLTLASCGWFGLIMVVATTGF